MEEKSVDILLSVYHPRIDFLEKQLDSLNNQEYKNIRVLIYDDCPNHRTPVEIFENHLNKTPFRLLPYKEKNIGYLLAFEELVKNSTGDFIAFCDQDDIWREDKIEISLKTMDQAGYLAVASDRMLINERDEVICESVRASSNKQYESWKSGDDICKYNLFITFAVGMCLVADGQFARSIIPFSRHTGHDKWLLSCASTEGTVGFINDTLVKYRRHSHNVSGVLVGISTKEDYLHFRVNKNIEYLNDFFAKYPNHKDKDEVMRFALARKEHKILTLFKYRYLAKEIAKFDIVLAIMPDIVFKAMLNYARRVK